MIEQSQSHNQSPQLPPPLALPKRHAAKWPPDDDDVPAGSGGGGMPFGGGGGGPIGPYDGDFRKGRFSPKLVLVAVLLLVAGAVLWVMAAKTEMQKMTHDQMAAVKKGIFILPRAEQLPKWRDLAKQSDEFELQQEGLMQLAWLDDKQGVPLATAALAQPDHRIRGVAAQVLAHYGTPVADSSKDALLKALAEADESDKPQLTWALVTLHDARVFEPAMAEYRLGHLGKVERLGGGPAFNPEDIAKLVSLDTLAKMATDQSDSVRQLIANILARNAESKWTDTLIKLVKDPSVEVAREAATGLGKIADERARGPLLQALATSDKDSRQKFLEAMRDGIGGEGLVIALGSVQKDKADTTWFQTRQIFEMLKKMSDPRTGDLLAKFLATKPSVHWMTEAGLRLAEIGDLRAVPYLAERMRLDPGKIYSDTIDSERALKRDDNERVVSARMLADLAVLHPEALADIRAKAEDAVIFWLKDKPQPHANGLRFLAASGSTKIIDQMRKWANPKIPLPKEGQQPPMASEWETAQSALRYVGWLKDPPSWGVMVQDLKRRDPKEDVTMDSLMGGGLAMLGMTLRAIEYGAADGFAQWGDPKAFPLLMKLIEDKMENEQSRMEACFALAWVATDDNMNEVVKKVHQYSSKDPKDQYIRACLLESLIHRQVPNISPGLVDMIDKDSDPLVRHQVGRVIGRAGFDEKVQAQLFKKLDDVDMRNDAALALLLGGGFDAASRAVAMYADYPKEQLDDLKDIYYQTFGYWSDEDFAKGRLYKWVESAEALARVRVRDALQDWVRLRLQAQFDNLDFDNGPRSMTRVVLRYRLMQDAKGQDAVRRKSAIQTLYFMKEQGCLMALRHESGEAGDLANKAFFELMNPKIVSGESVPAAGTAGGSVNVVNVAGGSH